MFVFKLHIIMFAQYEMIGLVFKFHIIMFAQYAMIGLVFKLHIIMFAQHESMAFAVHSHSTHKCNLIFSSPPQNIMWMLCFGEVYTSPFLNIVTLT